MAFELLVLPGVATAGGERDQVADLEVQVAVEGLGAGPQVVGPVDLQCAQPHIVVQVAGFLEVIGAQGVAQPVAERLAGGLQLFGPLVLGHVEGGLELGQRRAVQVHARIPVKLAIGADQLHVHVRHGRPVQRDGAAPVLQPGEAVAGLVGGVDVAGLEAAVIGQAVVVGIAVDVDAAQGGQAGGRARHRRGVQARLVAQGGEAGERHDRGGDAEAGVVERRQAETRVDLQGRIGRRRLVDIGVVAFQGDLEAVAGQEEHLAATAPLVLAARPQRGLVAGCGELGGGVEHHRAGRPRRQGVAVGDAGGARGRSREGNAVLPAVAALFGEGDAGQHLVAQRHVHRGLHIEA